MPTIDRTYHVPSLIVMHTLLNGGRLLFVGVGLAMLLWMETVRAQEVDLSFVQTRAEATAFEETTRYDELAAFVDVVAAASPRIVRLDFGYSVEGRALPLAVFGAEGEVRPERVRSTDKTRILVQGGIHGGEVSGKEAALMLLRALAAGQHAAWADSLVVLVTPLLNADGNERVDLYHRPRQHGPIGGVGQRANAQGYDLNRDHVKLDAPETRAFAKLLNDFDPHVVIDLHTTNGTHHGYHLTFAPPLHPATDVSIDTLLRRQWLPSVADSMRAAYGWETFYYGNVPADDSDRDRGWYTFDHRPRFSTNYAGLRNRFGILSEVYAYLPYEDRVLATLHFVEENVQYAYRHASLIRTACAVADSISVQGDTLALLARHVRSDERVELALGEVEPVMNPFTGEHMLRRLPTRRMVKMYTYGTFAATVTERAPAFYLAPPPNGDVRALLDAHGIQYTTITSDTTRRVERFRIDSVHVAPETYEGRRLHTLHGAYESTEASLPAGTLVIPVDQPLGRLAFYLLEPRSDDGLATWGRFDRSLSEAASYPVLRVPRPPF